MTDCLIGIEKNGTVRYIYCAGGGSEKIGRNLIKYFNTEEKIEKLFKLGDLYALNQHLAPLKEINTYEFNELGHETEGRHNWHHPHKDVCITYARDLPEWFGKYKIEKPKLTLLENYTKQAAGYYINYVWLFINNEWKKYEKIK